MTLEEAMILQSYPTHLAGAGKTAQATGRQRPRELAEPAHTITGSRTAAWLRPDRQVEPDEAATLQSYPDHIMKAERMSDLYALDLFAGTGWGVACNWLGIEEQGVDNMPEVIETREANGMKNLYHDVWDGLLGRPKHEGGNREGLAYLPAHIISVLRNYNLLIASPPCQTFSQAGKGEGRKALDQVIAAIKNHDYMDPEVLFELGEATDPRTALVLTPLAYAHRDRPKYIVFEQVPPVLPVWEAAALELQEMGYSTWTGILNSEQYGVPQTRRRAILIARNDGIKAAPPKPTHSKYYNRDAKRLDEGVLPWVSMAQALGWGTTAKPSYTVTGGGRETGGYEPFPTGARAGMSKAIEDGEYLAKDVEFNANVKFEHGTVRGSDQPAPTITGGKDYEDKRFVLRSNYGTNGDPAARGERSQDEPAATITSKADRNKWVEVSSQSVAGGPRAERDIDEPALTVTQNSDRVRFEERAEEDQWKYKDTPSTTIAGDPRITAREHHYHGEQNSTSFRLELAEAEVLQSYPPLVWKGTKGKQFLQIGNAVPPLLGKAILEVFL